MKSITKLAMIFIVVFQFASDLEAQCPSGTWCTAGNAVTGSEILGGTSSSSGDLQIRNDAAYNINFHTNGTQRMTILGNTNPGFVGIGLAAPVSLFHMYSGTFQTTNSSTNSTTADGFQISLSTLDVDLKQKEDAHMLFWTNDLQRMIIRSSGKVGIGLSNPAQQLDARDGSGNPQLELSYSGSFFTDFKTNSSGYLTIDPNGNRTGIDEASPGNTLDVNGGIRMNAPAGGSSSSDFIVLESNGDLNTRSITVPGAGVVNACGGNLTQYKVPVATSTTNVICDGQIYDNGSFVGINTTSNYAYPPRVNIVSTANGVNIAADESTTNTDYTDGFGLRVTNVNTGSGGYVYGILGRASGATNAWWNVGIQGLSEAVVPGGETLQNVGIGGTASGGTTNYGAYVSGSGSSTTNYGTYTAASGSSATNYGIKTTVSGGTTNYAIYADVGGDDANYAGYFRGNGVYTGTWTDISDAMFKENVLPLENALASVMELEPKTFNFDNDTYGYMNFPSGEQTGFLAQDVEVSHPGLVVEGKQVAEYDEAGNLLNPELDFLTINKIGMIPLLVGAVKELKAQVDDLQSQLDLCCEGGFRQMNDGGRNPFEQSENHAQITLENLNWVSLSDAIPNPFDEKTSISYNIPDDFSSAQVIFYNHNGQVIKTFEIAVKGVGSLDVYATNLSDGVYSYSLFVDGKMIDSKKMLKARQ